VLEQWVSELQSRYPDQARFPQVDVSLVAADPNQPIQSWGGCALRGKPEGGSPEIVKGTLRSQSRPT